MKRSHLLLAVLLAFGWLASALSNPVRAETRQPQIITSTPDDRGQVIHIVAPGENCNVIELAYYGSIDPSHALIRQQNPGIDENCTILIGQQLKIDIAAAATPVSTAGPSATPEPPTVTPTPFTGTTEICVLLFDDLNGDALRQVEEPVILGGAISVAETGGKFSETRETAINPDPEAYAGICFSDVPEGEYNIGAAIPDNYNPTMSLTYRLDVKAGDRAFVDFGAQSRDAPAAQTGTGEQAGGASPVLGIVGGLLLIGGIGLGWYALRLRNPRGGMRSGGLLRR